MGTSDGVKRLYKSRTNRMVDGVCGGLADYLGVDPTLVRITWVLLILLGGTGILLYIAGMIIIPTSPLVFAAPEQASTGISSVSNHRFWGILLVVVGSIWLMSNLGIWHGWWHFSWDFLLPTVLILAGVAFLFGGRNYLSNQQATPVGSEPGTGEAEPTGTRPLKLYRSRLNRKMFGVCGGLGAHFGIDATIVRILVVISAFASFGLTVFAYILMAIIVPEEPLTFPV